MASSENKKFLSLAKQFNYIKKDKTEESGSDVDRSEAKDFYEIILELIELQRKIGNLQLVEKQVEMRDRFSGLTNPASLSWLLQDLTEISENLSYIINNASKIQLKLANPAISNSLPLHSSLHQPVINITKLLADIHFNAERSATAASWLNEQDWAEVSKRLSSNKHNAEKLVARLKTSSSKIQLFRDGIAAN